MVENAYLGLCRFMISLRNAGRANLATRTTLASRHCLYIEKHHKTRSLAAQVFQDAESQEVNTVDTQSDFGNIEWDSPRCNKENVSRYERNKNGEGKVVKFTWSK